MCPLPSQRDSERMQQTDCSRIAWRRGDTGPTYVGSVSRGPEAIRLAGRDAILGIDVSLSVPLHEIEYVGVSDPSERSNGNPVVILDLADAEPIYLRPVGSTRLAVHLLARALSGLTAAPAALAEGGPT